MAWDFYPNLYRTHFLHHIEVAEMFSWNGNSTDFDIGRVARERADLCVAIRVHRVRWVTLSKLLYSLACRRPLRFTSTTNFAPDTAKNDFHSGR